MASNDGGAGGAGGGGGGGGGVLNKRQEWMSLKLQQCFGVDAHAADKCLRDHKKKIDLFLTDPKSPPKLFFYHQPRQFKVAELFLSVGGDGEKLEGKCLYFLRDSGNKPVNVKAGQDHTVLAGELMGDILQSFQQMLSTVFSPLLSKQPEWGAIKSDDERRTFLTVVDRFDDDLKRKLANLRGDVELRTPSPPYDKIEQKPASYAKASRDKAVLDHFQEIVTSWCEVITKYMEDDQSNTPIDKSEDKGPDVEIEYWSRRMLTLIFITEQLKTKPNRVVTGVLKARALRTEPGDAKAAGAAPGGGGGSGGAAPSSVDDNQLSEQETIKNLIERWREVDLAITDALNEAKDNVRFLENLHKVIEPLYSQSPTAIADTMPSLMNSMKMIHTLSRHYGTEVRMTNLFERITNQLITRCKQEIYSNEPFAQLWNQDPESVIGKMNASIKLCEEYRRHYKETKAKLATMAKGKQFNFDETAIFGKFTRFRRRLEKLIDMFSSIQQFKALEKKRIDGMEELIQSFENLVNEFKLKGHDLLDFYNTVFERDYVEFTMHNSGLENAIQDFMERSLTQMSSIDKQLELMRKFQDILHREALREDLDHKYLMIFKLYGEDLHNIQHLYEKHKDNPPIPRNMTRIAGNIHWSRQLLRRITSPMKKFQLNPKVFHPKESKKIVKHYNKLARTLIEFETLWFQAWQRSTDAAKKGLRSRLIVADPASNKLHVNFDHGVLQLMREAKHLQLMGFDIPNSARVVLLLEDKLKGYYNEISHALAVYNKVVNMVPAVCRSLLRPHLLDLENAIRPARTIMTWTSMNIDTFISQLHAVLARFEYLVSQINDIINNRVQKNLNLVSTMSLLNIPPLHTFTLRDFVALQRSHLESCTEILLAKNEEIERAVDDLIEAVLTYPLDPSVPKTSPFDVNLVKLHYCHLMYHALLSATKRSLNDLKKRVSSPTELDAEEMAAAAEKAAAAPAAPAAGGEDGGEKGAAGAAGAGAVAISSSALFEVDLSLQVPKVTLSPSLDEVQDAINAVARDVIQSTRKLIDWGIDPTATSGKRPRRPFYDRLASDKNLAIVLLLLTGAVEDTKLRAASYLSKYDSFSWLWQKDPETAYKEFLAQQQPILEDFVQELHKFVAIEGEIAEFPAVEPLGALHLKTDNLKAAFKHETERWKFQYSEKLHQEAKADMDAITEQMLDLKSKLEREVKDFASLKFVMDAQAEIRDVQSWIDSKFESIIERYNTLEKYLPFGAMTKDEMDTKSVLRTQWATILVMSSQVMTNINGLQGGFKQDLLENVKVFRSNVKQFRQDYDEHGPMVKNTSPLEAMTRLNKYKREFETLNRKYELFNGGEKLFGLPEQKYPDLVKTRKELRLLDQLYTLYQQVISTVEEYKTIPWSEVVQNIVTMNETVEQFNTRCRHLPRGLKTWEAYLELSQTIEDFIEILPLLTELSKPAMRDRHWKKISQLTGKEFDLEKFHELKLRTVLEANLLEYREDIEEITDSAEKQLAIEKKITEIQQLWDVEAFEFAAWKERGDVILSGSAVADVIEQLEDSQASLIQMLTQRHVTPFRDQANNWLKKLSDVNDTLESWIKVQMLWMSLEAVFSGGDIARQMPQDTRVFMKVDKEWTTRLMNKAKDVKNVVDCCQNEYIKNMLPTMFSDLEKCQKALDGYLEQKRLKFPRFYFVSNPALLLILSQGSDKDAVQQCFSKVFDAVDRVEFQGNNISKMRSQMAGFDGIDSEDIALTKMVAAKGNIEDWLNVLLKEMRRTMKDIVRAGANDFEAMQWDSFIAKYCAQVTLLGIQFMWTSDVQEALIRTKHDKFAMAGAFKKQTAVLQELSAMTTQDIKTKMDRTKVETLVTIQVHQRDVLQELFQRYKDKKLKDAYDFEWQKQLRCYWVPEDDECVVRIADVEFAYCYEYLGCKERLVVTPLTDRCYISLSQALGMSFGGAPAGPAGTGKTETVKDLGRALGKYVVVFNCSDQMHTADTAKIYKGLCQSGSWGCFDEFNRIDLEVLSVVAQQVQAVLTAVRARVDTFVFPGDDSGEVTLDDRCGFFITMNPGYAGRVELPENLKALFRSVAMMVPDREIIIKVKLASVGYNDFAVLAKKFRVLYKLCEEQLSKQRHYDFGLRNILSVLRTAGVNLRLELLKMKDSLSPQEMQRDEWRKAFEEMLMMRTLRDMNLSKLVADDVDLFISLLHDLFPNQKDPEKRRYDAEEAAMRTSIEESKLIHHDSWVNKIIQLYETSLVRHGLMMVGPAGSGKSTAIRVLIDALTNTHEKHLLVRMNPKAIKAEEMFGQNDVISGEWTHGIFSSIWQKYNDPKKHHTWIVCDGPVDAIWIENLNSVLDDNKLLTLANGDRLPMTDNVRLLFEVQDLRNASPATVSRAGIIFVSSTDLGYDPVVKAWLNNRREDEAIILQRLYEKYVVNYDIFLFLNRNLRNVMRVAEVHLITNCLHLLEGLLLDPDNEQKVHTEEQLERVFLYCLCWSLGSLLETEDRIKFSNQLCALAGRNLPHFEDGDTLYDFFVHDESMEWERWEAPEWEFPETFNFSSVLVPTVDSVRAEFLIDTIIDKLHKPVLVVGSSGTAKTSLVLQYTNNFDNSKMLLKKVNFSSATTPGMFQASIEADIEKRQGKTFAPQGGRWMTVFLDDISMPEVNTWGDQPTLEIVRQLIESGGFYFLEKDKRGDKKVIENLLYIGAMTHPGGGRNDIPDRLKRHFFCFNMTPPSQASIDNIYGSMLRGRFEEAPALTSMVSALTSATIDLWASVKARMLPTPSKFHYIFNMRDLARVFQGVLFSPINVVNQGNNLLALWKHECERVFCDKLTNPKDKKWFEEAIYKVMSAKFGESIVDDFREETERTYFVDFLQDEIMDPETEEILEDAPKIYERVPSVPALRLRVEDFLKRYNGQTGVKQMDLVLFDDALEHMMRISRIIGMPRGNALLVGVGGSGRQSLTRLAAYIGRHEIFQIAITRAYKMSDFLEDVRKMYVAVGKEGKKLTWILTDFDIINEEFLEYVNAILTTGEVAGLFPKDERDMMCSDLRGPARKELGNDFIDTPDNLYKYFIDRIRDNLHIVLAFSPANEKFAERARRFPGLISGCTIDWFLRWPEEALVSVSFKFLTEDKDFKVEADPKTEKQLVRHIATVHNLVTEACDEYFQKYRRNVYVTPKSYLSYIKSYKLVYREKLGEIMMQQKNVETGLKKLKEAEIDVGRLQGVLEQQNIDLGVADKAATAMLAKLEIGAKEAGIKKSAADAIEAKCTKTANQINEERAVANKELEAAMPFVRAAEKAAKSVNKKDIGIIQKLGKPPDLIKRIMDCVLILNSRPLDKVDSCEIKTGKTDFQTFVADSYDSFAKKMMVENGFVNTLLNFAVEEKDNINEETMELLEPYLEVQDFQPERAKTVSSAAEGLCRWVRAMHSYHIASLVVGPKLEQLAMKTNLFNVAAKKLDAAKASSKAAQDEVDKLQEQFSNTMKEKAALEQQARETQEKMQAANNLIRSLAGEKKRWQADALVFAEDKKKLVGNCALACAFVSYLGPFNHDFRKKLLDQYFYKDCFSSQIPVSKDLELNKFLVDDSTIAEWNSQGLPKDDLSIQNGILVTQASRYPLLIDPQNQAVRWIKQREAANFPTWGTTTISNPKLRDQLEFCMEEGRPILIEGVTKDVDPALDPVLDKNIITRGRGFYLIMGEKQVAIDPKFRLYLVTKLTNPRFSPELSAKTTIIDFSVTQKGLEDQLLSRVIQQEQKSLEEQRSKLIEEVNANTISLQSLDKQLLDRLSASQGNLLDDVALIGVLADTKTKAQEVKEKIDAAAATEQIINKKREHYRPVATRGSVIYFVIVSMAQVNCMYQSSLAQFLQWFDGSLQDAEKANLVAKRVEILMKHLTYEVYINVNRGLFEVDKLTFKLMITLKVLLTESEGMLDSNMVTLLLRGGSALGVDQVPRKPFDWLQLSAWLNVCQLSTSLDFFGDLKTAVEQNEIEWKKWYENESPEQLAVPRLEERLQSHPSGAFMRFLVVRSFRDDRVRLAANQFIGAVLGEKYVEPVPNRLEDIWRIADNRTPVILLLTPGADPTSQLEELAKKKGVKMYPVSMGEGQEPYAEKSVQQGMDEGAWSLLQNCHLGLGFMGHLEEDIIKAHEEKQVSTEWRLWITCEPHNDFPINLLQMSIKVTNEPPRGMKAGLVRSFSSVVDSEKLARVETKDWRDLVFALCFLHSCVTERKKFGAVGFNIPYEFTTADLEASLCFLEKHFFANQGLSWPTIRYMICQVQYGGRITDDFDRTLFDTFGKQWLTPEVFKEDFEFSSQSGGGHGGGHAFRYCIPAVDNIEGYRKYIAEFPSHDSPEIFGLHANADLTFGTNEALYIFNTISDTQPKESSGKSGGKTREETVYEKADELLALLPKPYKDDEVRDLIRKRKPAENEFVLGYKPEERVDGFTIPLNVFLYQEITRLNRIMGIVRATLNDLKQAINGEIIMTPELQNALNFVFNEKPPMHWYKDASGSEIAWYLPSLALWFAGLLDREKQLTTWLNTTRPVTYWLTGFFNPQGFLTAARQEITRRHQAEKWALDDVVIITTVTENTDLRRIKYPPNEGVYIHGLFMEGASWDRKDCKITESHPKELFTVMPVILVAAVKSRQAEILYAPKDDIKYFDCPVYKEPKRCDKYYIFIVKLRTNIDPDHWILRGVALLCSKE